MLLTASPAWGSGAYHYSNAGNNGSISAIDGGYFQTYGPTVDQHIGSWSFTAIKHNFSPEYYANWVGFATKKELRSDGSVVNRYRYAYEIYGPGQGDTIYWLNDNYWWEPGQHISAGMWRVNDSVRIISSRRPAGV
jgi:hypothetical protein